ncbi:MAG: Ig-like domain-containing protein [Chloroflexota bacterium]|nr:Ig-like domain-containing protein [Chloroflexota bacterium]
MQPRFMIGLGLFVTIITTSFATAMGSAAAPPSASHQDPCVAGAPLLPVSIDVPANGTVTFDVADLVRSSPDIAGCPDMAAIDASSFVAHAGEGGVTIIPGRQSTMAGWTTSPLAEDAQRFVFTPRPGFNGVSQGWEFVIYGRDESGQYTRIGTVKTTFRVRNTVPVATDDAVTIAPRLGGICVGMDDGVLANDADANGDPVIVYSEGVTSYPWGAVEVRHDGSYRVTVTDPEVSGTAQVRYVIWDQVGSTTSTDFGILTLTFEDAAPSQGLTGHHRFLGAEDAVGGGCGEA